MTDPTARQRLLDAMRNRTCFCGAASCQNPEPLVDAYAHELAEQQRAWARAGNVSTTEVYRAADHIDPGAQR